MVRGYAGGPSMTISRWLPSSTVNAADAKRSMTGPTIGSAASASKRAASVPEAGP